MRKIIGAFKLIFFVFISWIAAHFYALTGIFIALGYPVAWLISPQSVICFSCRTCKPGETCELCRKKTSRNERPFPKNIRSIALNSAILMALAILSIALVIVEMEVLNRFGFTGAKKTARVIIPTQHQYRLGEIFPLALEVTGIETPINAVQIDLGFDADYLQIIEVDKSDSFASIFVQEEINNDFGFFRLSGGLPNPGFGEPQGKFATVYFQTLKPGATEVEFLPSSIILANDGRGTNVLKEMNNIGYIILPEKVSEGQNDSIMASLQEKADIRVLGERSDTNVGTKLDFTTQTQVLGESTTASDSSEEDNLQVNYRERDKTLPTKMFRKIVDVLSVIDRFILDILKKLLGNSLER